MADLSLEKMIVTGLKHMKKEKIDSIFIEESPEYYKITDSNNLVRVYRAEDNGPFFIDHFKVGQNRKLPKTYKAEVLRKGIRAYVTSRPYFDPKKTNFVVCNYGDKFIININQWIKDEKSFDIFSGM